MALGTDGAGGCAAWAATRLCASSASLLLSSNHAPTCGYGPALEHNGDLYACDHFVEPAYRLGNIHQTHMLERVSSPRQRKFGLDKRDTLTAQCRSCEVLHLCNGGCPKDRFARSRDGEPGQNHVCAGFGLSGAAQAAEGPARTSAWAAVPGDTFGLVDAPASVDCGCVSVPLRHAEPSGPTIALATVIVRAPAAGRVPDPVFIA